MPVRKSVIPLEDLWTDPRDDYVGRLLIRLKKYKTWTSEKRRIYEDLLKELDESRYSSFWGTPRCYLLSQIGESGIYAVPKDKFGNLMPYRGKVVRIICTGNRNAGWGRKYSVAVYKSKK
ncbi:hypothetical protein N9P58_01930 [Puniceicoccaceae bacterium]|nr:hypothetical protein [Puniceicoccaceae bacterium]